MKIACRAAALAALVAVTGSPSALGPGAEGNVYTVSYNHMNLPGPIGEITTGFKSLFIIYAQPR